MVTDMSKKSQAKALSFVFTLLASCQNPKPMKEVIVDRPDVHSYAELSQIHHLNLDLIVDFEKNIIEGSATYDILPNGADHITLDIQGPEIDQITVDDQEVEYRLGEQDPILGQALRIPIHSDSKKISVHYKTQSDAGALQWLSPMQTSGKKHPFMFSQGEAILTRTWIPIQDSPGIRFTYEATLHVPAELMAVMSATNVQTKNTNGIYHFTMPQPVPAYLIAIAVGDLSFKILGPRTGVYAEPSVLEKAANEFVDTEHMITAAENLYGPYAWDRYDLLVLPPSFPFGGMENPRLTFVTPTVIAGDRSLVSLIAHELAHSWSGNYVTNSNWNDFWINEGFTTYFERRIMESLYGRDYSEMLASLALQEWKDLVLEMGDTSKDSYLHLDLIHRNPDDGMTNIAYEKGSFFLRMLEEKIGRERFDVFLKNYFAAHAFQSMDSEKLIEYMNTHLPLDSLQIDLASWIYRPGIPADTPIPASDRFNKVEAAFVKMNSTGIYDTKLTKDWSSHEWIHFISLLPEDASVQLLKNMDLAFKFTTSGNCEILDIWFEKAIKAGYAKDIMDKIEAFLVQIGRRKYIMPLYKAFKTTGQLETARKIYAQARPNYHSVSVNSVDLLLKE